MGKFTDWFKRKRNKKQDNSAQTQAPPAHEQQQITTPEKPKGNTPGSKHRYALSLPKSQTSKISDEDRDKVLAQLAEEQKRKKSQGKNPGAGAPTQDPVLKSKRTDHSKDVEKVDTADVTRMNTIAETFKEFKALPNKHAKADEFLQACIQLDDLDKKYDLVGDSKAAAVSEARKEMITKSEEIHKIKDDTMNTYNLTVDAKNSLVSNISSHKQIYKMIWKVTGLQDAAHTKAISLATEEANHNQVEDSKKDKWIQDRAYEIMDTIEDGADPAIAAPEESKLSKSYSIIEFFQEFATNIIGNVSDISDFVKSCGGHDELLDDLKDGKWKKVDAKNPEWPDIVGAVGGFVKFIWWFVDAIKMMKDISDTKGELDKQEAVQMSWDCVDKVLDFCTTSLDILGCFLGFVPFLGSAIGLFENAIAIAQQSRDIYRAGKRKGKANESLKKLKEAMAYKKKKYQGTDSENFFDITDFSDSALRHKKNELMADVASQDMHIDKKFVEHDFSQDRVHVLDSIDKKVHGWFGRGDKTEKWDEGYSGVNAQLQAHMQKTRDEFKGSGKAKDSQEGKDYKKKMHRMEAIQLIIDYETQEAARHKNQVSQAHSGYDLGKEIVKTVLNVTQLVSEITGAATGFGAAGILVAKAGKATMGVYESVEHVGTAVASKMVKRTQRNANKEFHRHQMATNLCERMAVLGNLFKSNGLPETFAQDTKIGDNVSDSTIRYLDREFDFVVGVRETTNMKVSSVINAGSRGEVVSSLSNIFSQDGN